MAQPRTLFDKIWDSHVIAPAGEGTYLLYIDLHLCHEVTTPQAFEGLKLAGRKVRRPDATIAVADHNIPTSNRAAGIDEPESKLQVDTLERNVVEFGVPYFPIDSINQGIVHIIGPEQGLSQPGMTIVCGDSHTATHGALGALAFGIGTSEVEHVLATQTLIQAHAKNMLVEVNGTLGAMVKNAVVPFPDGTQRVLHCVESPEHWFEDFGTAKLKKGRATVKLDADFAKVVTSDYHVFIMPGADCRGLYVRRKTAKSFEVRELQDGTSSVAFSYRIVARRKDIKRHRRFAKIDTRLPAPPTPTTRKSRPTPRALRKFIASLEKEARARRPKEAGKGGSRATPTRWTSRMAARPGARST